MGFFSYQYGRQPPEVQLLGGQTVGFALGAIVELILTQLLFTGEGLQTAVQTDGLGLGTPTQFHTSVLLHYLHETQSSLTTENRL